MVFKIRFPLCSLIIYVGACVAYKYTVSVNDDMGPCDNGKPYVDKYVDMTHVVFTKTDDDILIIDGNLTTLVDLTPRERLSILASYFRKDRGLWKKLPMNQVIPDLCTVLFSPLEIWYPVSKQLKGDARKCPPPKGTVYTVNKAELVGHYDFAKSVSGEYMVQIDGTYGKMEGCIQVTAEVRQDA